MLQDTFSKNILMMKRTKNVFSINIVVHRNLFLHFRSVFKINNSFVIKNFKISHFENFNHASHLNTKKNKANTNKQQIKLQ